MNNIYHDLRNINPESARKLLRDSLNKNFGNVSKVAKIFKIHRKTVRRARDGSLMDHSRKPHNSPFKTIEELEDLIISEAKNTGYRYRILTDFIFKKYSIKFNENTVKNILKRNNIKKKKIRCRNRNSRPLYDYKNLLPFVNFQIDTKHILDKSALPSSVYEHIQKHKLPKYEWNAIDVKTRTRFTAYSHNLTACYGFAFISMIILWCRTHNVRETINIQFDNGIEFCSGSSKKLQEYNDFFSILDVKLNAIPPGAKHLQAIVENSHRKDDEYFFSIHPERCLNNNRFIDKCQQWQDTWNAARPHFGIEMYGLTPFKKFLTLNSLISKNIFHFPVVLLESLVNKVGTAMEWFNSFANLFLFHKSGHYVFTTCLFL